MLRLFSIKVGLPVETDHAFPKKSSFEGTMVTSGFMSGTLGDSTFEPSIFEFRGIFWTRSTKIPRS